MAKKLTCTLNVDAIYNAVKSETYISGKTELQANAANSAKVYNEQAGDDAYHEEKLKRTLRHSLGKLMAFMVDFVDSAADTPMTDTLNAISTTNRTFVVTFMVNTRFNGGLAGTIASLMQEYLIENMISLWWAAVADRKNDVTLYTQMAVDTLNMIRKCLSKKAPVTTSATDEAAGSISDESSTSSGSTTEEEASGGATSDGDNVGK